MTSSYKYVKDSVARRVAWVQSLKDGPCERCGARKGVEDMHWHHRDPATKEFGISRGAFRFGRARLLAEIAKCELLCGDCHHDHHAPDPGHGTTAMYQRGCRCDTCREANREYMRAYRASKRVA